MMPSVTINSLHYTDQDRHLEGDNCRRRTLLFRFLSKNVFQPETQGLQIAGLDRPCLCRELAFPYLKQFSINVNCKYNRNKPVFKGIFHLSAWLVYNKKTAACKAPEGYSEVVSGARDVVLVPLLMYLSESKVFRSEATQGVWGVSPPMSRRLSSATKISDFCSGSGSRTHKITRISIRRQITAGEVYKGI